MKNKIFIILGLAVIIAALFMLFSSGPKPAEGKTWVSYAPVQCLGNPWEQDWIKVNGNDPAKYPKEQETEIIKGYYEKQGVSVFEVKSTATNKVVCQACSCSRGDELTLLVASSDVETMRDLGFEIYQP